MAPLTMSVPVLGALTAKQQVTPQDMIGLMLVGLCAHLFGFSFNDLVDQSLDSTVAVRQKHPLVTGRLNRAQAWVFTLIQIPLALSIYLTLGGRGWGLTILCASIGLSVVYNLWSKRGILPRFLPELALALSVGMLCLSGALLTSRLPAPKNSIYSLTMTLVLLLLNSVSSGLKDLKTDSRFGVRNFLLSTGTRMLDDDNIHISKTLLLYCIVLQGAILACLLILIKRFEINLLMGILIFGLNAYGALHLRMVLTVGSMNAVHKSMPLLNGYYNYAAVALMVAGQMPIVLRTVFGLLVLWLLIIPWRLSFRVWRNRYQPTRYI